MVMMIESGMAAVVRRGLRRWPLLLLALLLAGLLLLWRASVTAPNFAHDDAYHLFLVSDLSWYRCLFVPEVYQRISTAHLTPLSVAYYTLAVRVAGLSAENFLWLHLTLFGTWLWTFAALLHRRYRLLFTDLAVFVLLTCCLGYLGSLLSRFYTAHYLFGGLLAVLALLCLDRWQNGRSRWFGGAAAILILLAMLSKEVFLGLPLIAIMLFWSDRSIRRALLLWLPVLWGVYLLYRGYMLGTWFGGRDGQLSLFGMLRQVFEALPTFLVFYARTHVLLMLLLVYAAYRSPRVIGVGLLLAGVLLAPMAAALHALQRPELHADRLLIAADLVLVAAVAVALAQRAGEGAGCRRERLMLFVLLLAGIGGAWRVSWQYHRKMAETVDFRITQAVLAASPAPAAVYLPPEYGGGSLIAAYARRLNGSLRFSANCLDALNWGVANAMYFGRDGVPISRSRLAADCRASTPVSLPVGEVSFRRGVLSWQLRGYSAGLVGVYFPAHALYIPAAGFSQRLVRPVASERYQLYWQHEGKWWFSAPMIVRFD